MIKSFKNKAAETLANGKRVREFQSFEQGARRKLRMLEAAESLNDLAAVPGNRLETLAGNRSGQHSIRVNDQWRVCFVWRDGDAFDVEIVDYH